MANRTTCYLCNDLADIVYDFALNFVGIHVLKIGKHTGYCQKATLIT